MPANDEASEGSRPGDAALPVAFSGLAGLFKPAAAGAPACGLSVVFLAPWGIDELCTRRFFRIAAEVFSESGIASLRFDYPGTANALDAPGAAVDIAAWTDAAVAATQAARDLSGTGAVVFIGFGLGAAIALKAGEQAEDLAGLALLAPVAAGRRYLRELSVWSAVVDEGVGVAAHMRDTAPGAIAGFSMPDGVVATLPTLTAETFAESPVPHVFLAARPDNAADRQLRGRLAEKAASLRDFTFLNYDKLVSNPLGQEIPDDLIAALAGWLSGLAPATAGPARLPPAGPAVLTCGPVRETTLRFGPGDRLIGTLCEPLSHDGGVTVVLLTTSYDPQSGWARSGVELARRLAQGGVASLRYDSAGVGDSPPVPGRRGQVLYDDAQMADAAAARDLLDTLGRSGPALLFGRCSGAYVAFRAAAEDARWAGCIAVNPYVFRWLEPPSEEMVLRAPRPLADYSGKAFKLDTFRRLLAGEIDIRSARRNIAMRIRERLSKKLAPLLGLLLATERHRRGVLADFHALSQRAGRISLVYSEGDAGLDSLHDHFGKQAERLGAYPNVDLHILPDADHNVTPRSCRERLYAIVEQAAGVLARK